MSHHFFVFLVAATLFALLPGPGMFYVASRSLAAGRAVGLASCAGTGLGGLAQVAAGAAGVSALVLASAQLFALLKLAGAVYLVWLGVRMIAKAGEEVALAPVRLTGPLRALADGALVEAFNPKTALFFLAFIPQFIAPGGAVALQFACLALVSVVLSTAGDMAVAMAAGSLGRGLAQRGGLAKRLNQGAGGVLISLGLGLALTRRPFSP
jgi:threonine/homoserine/homoserine lactone efflux protein